MADLETGRRLSRRSPRCSYSTKSKSGATCQPPPRADYLIVASCSPTCPSRSVIIRGCLRGRVVPATLAAASGPGCVGYSPLLGDHPRSPVKGELIISKREGGKGTQPLRVPCLLLVSFDLHVRRATAPYFVIVSSSLCHCNCTKAVVFVIVSFNLHVRKATAPYFVIVSSSVCLHHRLHHRPHRSLHYRCLHRAGCLRHRPLRSHLS